MEKRPKKKLLAAIRGELYIIYIPQIFIIAIIGTMLYPLMALPADAASLAASPDEKTTEKSAGIDGDTMEKANTMSILNFLKMRRNRRWTRTPRKILAFYYTWYGTPELHGRWKHWESVDIEKHDIAASTHYPEKGPYDSHNPEIINYHIDLAKSCGIDGFICTWWMPWDFHDKAFAKVLDYAAQKDFEVTIYWETAPGKGELQINLAVFKLLHVLEKYGSHPAFLKLDGKPVLFVYGRVMNQIPMNAWPEIIAQVQRRYAKDFLLIADGYQESYVRLFDGIHTYNICNWVQGKQPDELQELSEDSFNRAVKIAKNQAKISCITVIPGYDDTKIRTPGIKAERLAGKTYRVLWEEAIAADPDWILITSWNEWHEGSEIEPSLEYGDQYIRMTAAYSKLFKQTETSQIQIPESPSGIPSEKAFALRQIYEGKTIAILPDFSGQSVFRLADTGIVLKELTWQEVLEPSLFNVKHFPVVIYAGSESYTQTVKQRADVDEAILRYLREGGLLMALPSGPFPFYYNENGKVVVSARKFGFPIEVSGRNPDSDVRGWETPPSGVKLTFKINNKLLEGLPPTVGFPETEDLRWRPGTDEGLPEGDIYLPLARLEDEAGRFYGDGIVYIHHQVSEPKNGRNLYVWMRMPDILNSDDLLYALFHFVGKKIR